MPMNKGGKHFRTESIITYLFMFVLIGGGIVLLKFLGGGFTGFVVFGSDWNLVDNEDGSFNLKIFGGNVNYFNGSSYEPFNTSLGISSDGLFDYIVNTSLSQAFFKEDPTQGQVVKFVKNSTEVTFQPMALNYINDVGGIQQISMIQSVIGIPSDNTFIYTDAYGSGIDLLYSFAPNILKENLIIENLSNLPTITLSGTNYTIELNFNLGTDASRLVINGTDLLAGNNEISSQNEVQVENVGGDILYSFSKPYAYDSAGESELLTYFFKKQGPSLTIRLSISYDWLNSSTRVYPVYIDPTIIFERGDDGDDVYVDKSSANKNHGDKIQLKVQKSSWQRSYLKFNISSIPQGQIIDLASLCVFLDNDQGSQTISINHVYNDTWCEGNGGTDGNPVCEITWNNQPCGTDELIIGGECNASVEDTFVTDGTFDDVLHCFSIKEMLSIDYPDDEISMVLWTTDAGNADIFSSKEDVNSSRWPFLNVTYHAANSAPSLTLFEPQNTLYTTNESLALNFSATDGDDNLDSCWYNIDGGANLSLTSCANSTFNVATEGSYILNLYANDTSGLESSDNVNFNVDLTGILVSIIQPTGTKTSRTDISLQYTAVGNNLTCLYNVETSIGGEIIGNTTLTNCSNSSFTVSSDGDYVTNLFVNNTLGSINSTSSSFTVSTSSGGSGGGSSSSGGGGGGRSITTTIIQTTNTTTELTVNEIFGFITDPGDSKTITWIVKNTGTNFLNNCVFEGFGDYLSWISGEETKSLSVGEEYNFVFDLNIPEDIGFGSYKLGVVLNCEETSNLTRFNVEILEKKLRLDLLEVVRENDESVRVNYLLEELSGIDQDVNLEFLLFDNNEKVAETLDFKSISANSKDEFEIFININPSLRGNLNLLINLNSETYSTFVQEDVILGAPISGFAIFGDLIESNSIISYAMIILFVAFAFFIIRRIFKFRNQVKHKNKRRKLIRKNQ